MEPSGETLSRNKIDNLQHGDSIIIIWSGGNGPHTYRVFRLEDGGEIFAATEREFLDGILPDPDRQLNGDLSFVGREKPYTRVWREVKIPEIVCPAGREQLTASPQLWIDWHLSMQKGRRLAK